MPSIAPLVEDTGKRSWHLKPILLAEDGIKLQGTGDSPHIIEVPPNKHRIDHRAGPEIKGNVSKPSIKVDVAKDAEDRGGKRL